MQIILIGQQSTGLNTYMIELFKPYKAKLKSDFVPKLLILEKWNGHDSFVLTEIIHGSGN